MTENEFRGEKRQKNTGAEASKKESVITWRECNTTPRERRGEEEDKILKMGQGKSFRKLDLYLLQRREL
jgi:hypothetical protein